MSYTSFTGGGFLYPSTLHNFGTPAFTTTLLIDASTEKAAFIFQAPETGTINTVEFATGTISVNAASVIRCSLQDVSLVNGDPDGVQDQYRDVLGSALSSNAWIQPGLLTSDGTNGGVKRSVTRGDLLAFVVEYQTFTAADSIIVRCSNQAGSAAIFWYQYIDLNTGAWAKTSRPPILAIQYDDGLYKPVGAAILPIKAINSTAFASNATPDERGLKFTVPVPMTIRGASVILALTGAGGGSIVLYDTDGTTVLRSYALDADVKVSTGTGPFVVEWADVDLVPGGSYRLTLLPSSTTNITLYDFDVQSNAHLDAVEGGSTWIYTQRTDAGAWTDTNTKRPFISLWVSAIAATILGTGILLSSLDTLDGAGHVGGARQIAQPSGFFLDRDYLWFKER